MASNSPGTVKTHKFVFQKNNTCNNVTHESPSGWMHSVFVDSKRLKEIYEKVFNKGARLNILLACFGSACNYSS